MELSFLLQSPLPIAVHHQAVQECLQVESEFVHVHEDSQYVEKRAEEGHVSVYVWNKPDKELKQAVAIHCENEGLGLPEDSLLSYVEFLRDYCLLTESEFALMGGDFCFPYLSIQEGKVFPVSVKEDLEQDNLSVQGRLPTPFGAILSPTSLDADALLLSIRQQLALEEEEIELRPSFSPLDELEEGDAGFSWIRSQGFFTHGLLFESTSPLEWIPGEQAVSRWLDAVKRAASDSGEVLYAWHAGMKYYRQTAHGLDFHGESYRVLPTGALEKIVYKLFHHHRK